MATSEEKDRHRRVEELFLEVCDLPAEEQRRFLERKCDDREIRREVLELLGHDAAPSTSPDHRIRMMLADVAPAEENLESVGAYRVVRLIGRGGMGSVYEAEQVNPKRRVALKVVNAVVAAGETRRRFELEAHVLGLLQHPGIARIIEAGTFDHGRGSQPYFAMELVDGERLTDYAQTHRLSSAQRLELLARVCDAVHHAHQRGVVHRDLKPANILVDQRGDPKVLDFGVARVTEADRAETLQTAVGQIVGTLGYMSPEQARGEPDVDTSSDVYSLGVVLYELLTGRMPYEAARRSVHEAIRAITETEPTPLPSVVPRLRGDVATIVHKALSKERERRYESAAALAADIRRFLRHEPIAARPPTTMYQLAKFARRHRALAASAVIVLVSLTAGLATSLWSLADAKTAREAEGVARRRAEREARTAEAINEFILQDMLRAANPFHGGREVRVVDVLEAAEPRIDAAFAERPLVGAAVRLTLGTSYRELGLWREAEPVLAVAAEERARRLGDDHPDTLDAQYEHAIVLGALHDDRALAELRTLREAWSQSLGATHPRTLRVLGDEANMLASIGQFDGAIELARRAYEQAAASLGAGHEATRANQRKLAEVLESAGRFAEAEPLLVDHLATIESERSADDPDVLDLRVRLAQLVMEQGRFEEAVEELVGVIERLDAVFGAENARSLIARASLASVYDTLGRCDEATALHEFVCRGYENALGRSHVHTLVARNNLAINLRRCRDYERAEQVAREVLQERRAELGDEDKQVAESLDTLGAIQQERGDRPAAVESYAEALYVARRAFGEEHPRTVDILFNRASLAIDMEDYEVAEREFRRLIEIDTRLHGETHPYVVAEVHQLGQSLLGQQRYEEAIAAYTDAIERSRRGGNQRAWAPYVSAAQIAKALLQLERPEEAEPHALDAYRGLKALGDEYRLRRLAVVETIVRVHRALGRADDAARYQAEIDAR